MIIEELKRLAVLGIDAEIARLQIRRKELLAEPVAKPHWTQTPEGKRKMAAIQKKAWSSRRKSAAKEKAPTTAKAVRAEVKR